MTKRNKISAFLGLLILVGYIGFYYHVTHDFKANINVDPFMISSVAKQFKTQESRAAYVMDRLKASSHCEIKNNPCENEIGFFINPYNRQRSLISCESRLRTLILVQFINDPEYDCRPKLQPPHPMKKK
ncbi:MAG: hypothetical protein JW812_03185 [Alphaproteobacteria bacterium]|nr:hypothetical protein [Alphaproteobacteria bacterium]MBN2779848.1 hypothetical protein [Alphaproteobacteria bacterium]